MNEIHKPIRILHVLFAMNMAGTETLLMNLYRGINRELVQFDFAVSTSDEGYYDKEINMLGGKIYHYPRYNFINHYQYKKWWNTFLDNHKEYHIIHGHIGSTAAIYLKIAKEKGIYTIAHSHSTKSSISLHSLIYNLFAYPTRYIADQFFGCSKQALIDRYGKRIANSTNACVINNSIDANKFIYNVETRERIRKEYNIKSDELVLMTVGRLTQQKNPHEIINICEGLNKNNVKFRFLWFGSGSMENELRKEVTDKKLDHIISFMGNRSDINNVLQAADIFIFPSIWEGLGIACVEAQAAGLPTLCSDTIPKEAQVSEICRFLPLNDTKAWIDSIINTIDYISDDSYVRPNTYENIVKAGYDIKETAKWLEKYYLNLEIIK